MQKLISFERPIRILSHASAVGKEEKRGPLGGAFDYCDPTCLFGAKTWELAESNLSRIALALALKKARLSHGELDFLLAGDLQNQCVASSCAHTALGIPYLGLYGACSTSAEGLFLAASLLSGSREYQRGAVVTSSHFCAAERQFRLPLEYGGQRPPTAQWTATASGAFLLTKQATPSPSAVITGGMIGIPIDGGISDASNMGAAMAPAAAHTILSYFQKSKEDPKEWDAIVTGDLGYEGSEILARLLSDNGLSLADRHVDCGTLLYNPSFQDVHAGGSGCGCSASVLSSHFLPLLEQKKMKRILFLATGALMSPSSILQGEAIVGIAPLIRLEADSFEKEDTAC